MSVIIPTFNRASLLRAAVASVLDQSVLPDEIIVVDDGSTDETAEVCRAFRHPVRYLYQANAGVPTARNHGVAESTGELIAFLDSDDLWHPRKLEVQLAAFASWPELGCIATDCLMVGPSGAVIEGSGGIADGFPVFRAMRQTPNDFFERRLRKTSFCHAGHVHEIFVGDAFELFFYGNFVFPSAAVLRREVWDQVGPFDPALLVAQDNEFFHRLASKFPVGIVMTPLMHYRVGLADKNTAPANTVHLIRNAIESVDRAAESPRGLTVDERAAYRAGRHRLVRRLAYTHLSEGEQRKARDVLSRGWRGGTTRMTPDTLLLYAAGLLPGAALRSIHHIKRKLAGRDRG